MKKDALYMYVENELGMKRVVLNHLPGELYTIEANDKIPDNCTYPSCSESKSNKHRRFSKVAKIKNWCKSNVNS